MSSFIITTYSHLPIGNFESVAKYIEAVPSRDKKTLLLDLKTIAKSGTARNPFTKAMKKAIKERLLVL